MIVSLPVVPLEERLREERRSCPACAYKIANPLTDRCPRCFALVPRVDVQCGSCTHQGACEFGRSAAADALHQHSHSPASEEIHT
jgi:hypothetical protein